MVKKGDPSDKTTVVSGFDTDKASSIYELSTLSFDGWERYKVLNGLGSGGTAVVYKAFDPVLNRHVALKFLLGGDPAEEKRFLLEARAQAQMDHDHICKIYEIGTYSGKQYIAMQFIDGESLEKAATKMTVEEKCRIMLQVSEAVHSAHRLGIIHRDLKPGNVMVEQTETGWRPYVLDFGLARQVALPGTTIRGLVLGTPSYMSPEQAWGNPEALDRRTDVYSLGATMYRIFSGRPPHDGKTIEIIFDLANKDPLPLRKIASQVPLDVQTIIMKCLEREPDRRYDSARALSEELKRYLDGDPITARPPDLLYKLSRKAKKHKVIVTVAGIALASIILSSIIFVVEVMNQRNRAEEARRVAEHEAARANAVKEFLQTTLTSADPFGDQGRDITLVEALRSASKQIEQKLKNQPEIEAEVRNTIGVTFLDLGHHEDAEQQLNKALGIWKNQDTTRNRYYASTLDHLGTLYQEKGMLNESENAFRQALTIRKTIFKKDDAQLAQSMNNLAVLLRDKGQIEEAERLHRQALDMRKKIFGPDHEEVATSLNNLGGILVSKGDYAGAEAMFREVLRLDIKRYGEDHPNVALSLNNLAYVLQRNGKLDEAESLHRKTLSMNERLLGKEHPLTANSLNNLGRVLLAKGNLDEAERTFQNCLSIRRKILGADHPHIAITLNFLGQTLQQKNQCQQAELLFREALSIFTKSDFDPAPRASVKSNLGECLMTMNRLDEAEKMLTEGHSELLSISGANSPETQLAQKRLAQFKQLQDKR
ncbi:MAG TPA: serine/threonine-protein kinase [Acidobacteriota bacterium]|nr:serine/threonine-protein kinase [Acidobacteriota bacterium]